MFPIEQRSVYVAEAWLWCEITAMNFDSNPAHLFQAFCMRNELCGEPHRNRSSRGLRYRHRRDRDTPLLGAYSRDTFYDPRCQSDRQILI